MLVGFDFGGTHFFGEHPHRLKKETPWPALIRSMTQLAVDLARERCPVINCSPSSALPFWPKKTLAEALAVG